MGQAHGGNLPGLSLLAGVLFLAITAPALGQGFMVKPMRIEAVPRPGTSVELPLELRNTAADGPRSLLLRVADLSQNPDGSWRLIELDSGEDISRLASCREWISLSAQQVEIAPMEPAVVKVQINAPANSRGTYFAALIVETPIPERIQGMVVRVRFLIPVIVEIQGRPVRQQIKLEDLELNYFTSVGEQPATSLSAMRIINEGLTYSRVRGDMQVEMFYKERWRPIAKVDVPEKGIIPGVTLKLGDDLKRRLPSGKYRMRGNLYVDGRRVAPMEKEIEFEGDPSVTTLAYDTALILEPAEVVFDASPGATRTSVVQVENPSEDALTVNAEAVLPPSLMGVTLGDLRGDALSAAPWVTVRPAEFTLRAGGKQNLRVITQVPREDVDFARYYADLVLHAAYADGQSAGDTRTMLTVVNGAIAAEPVGQIERVSLAADEGSVYVVQAQFANVGNVHMSEVVGQARVLAAGSQVAVSTALDAEPGILLPLGQRRFGGTLDFATVEPGPYVLEARITFGEGKFVTRRLPIRVESDAAGIRSVVVLDEVDDAAVGGESSAAGQQNKASEAAREGGQ